MDDLVREQPAGHCGPVSSHSLEVEEPSVTRHGAMSADGLHLSPEAGAAEPPRPASAQIMSAREVQERTGPSGADLLLDAVGPRDQGLGLTDGLQGHAATTQAEHAHVGAGGHEQADRADAAAVAVADPAADTDALHCSPGKSADTRLGNEERAQPQTELSAQGGKRGCAGRDAAWPPSHDAKLRLPSYDLAAGRAEEERGAKSGAQAPLQAPLQAQAPPQAQAVPSEIDEVSVARDAAAPTIASIASWHAPGGNVGAGAETGEEGVEGAVMSAAMSAGSIMISDSMASGAAGDAELQEEARRGGAAGDAELQEEARRGGGVPVLRALTLGLAGLRETQAIARDGAAPDAMIVEHHLSSITTGSADVSRDGAAPDAMTLDNEPAGSAVKLASADRATDRSVAHLSVAQTEPLSRGPGTDCGSDAVVPGQDVRVGAADEGVAEGGGEGDDRPYQVQPRLAAVDRLAWKEEMARSMAEFRGAKW
jgi:hypothetical protein